jgi:ribosomal biogenesis protein LAS1
MQGVLKSYVKERKAEVKRRGKADTKAAESAVASFLFLDVAQALKQKVLLDLLVDEKAILPADKKLGSNMSGAFLIWTPFLLALCKATPVFLHSFLERMVDILASTVPGMLSVESEPGRDGLYEWCTHILASNEWKETRQRTQNMSNSGTGAEARLLEHALGLCFTTPTLWTLKLADAILQNKNVVGRESWLAILEAARSEDVDMEIEGSVPLQDVEMQVDNPPLIAAPIESAKTVVPKMRGPQKRVGLWKPLHIGTLVGGG